MFQMTKVGSQISCACGDGKEVISAVGFSFAPNMIDFSSVFSKFDISSQGAVLGVQLGVFFLATILFIWAHYMDRKGIMQVFFYFIFGLVLDS